MITNTNICLKLVLFITLTNSSKLYSVSCSTINEIMRTTNSSIELSYCNLISQNSFSRLRRRSRRAFSCIQYYPNSTASFQLLLQARDIELNPGPLNMSSDHQHQSHQKPNTISPSTVSLCREMPSGLKIVHWNLNTIAPHPGNCKLDELRLLLSNPGKDCHILGITETWLNSISKILKFRSLDIVSRDLTVLKLIYLSLNVVVVELLHI